MKKIVIVGGKLQGLEAAYLASKAGIETILVDRRQEPIAKALCTKFLHCDIIEKSSEMIAEFTGADLVLPALEDDEALMVLTQLAGQYGFRLAFDLKAYAVSSSKLLSDRLFHDNGIPAPAYYPGCKTPYIVKPSNLSGSHGVRHIESKDKLEKFLKSRLPGEEWVAQEFLSGPSYSIEIIGEPGEYKTYEITEIHMDEAYDCKRVTAPCDISSDLRSQFSGIAERLASLLELKGIMDVEVIEDEGILKVLEIDARIPSQTPTAVYHSTGINMVIELYNLFCEDKITTRPYSEKRFTAYEHFLVEHGRIRVLGERIMGAAGPLRLITGFCGADEALTDYTPGSESWRATFINAAGSSAELFEKRSRMIGEISRLQGSSLQYVDKEPVF